MIQQEPCGRPGARLPRACLGAILALLYSGTPAAGLPPQGASDDPLLFEAWAEDLAPTLERNGLAAFAPYVEHDILGFRLEYTTTYRGEEIEVSGLIAYPMDLDGPAPILVWNHGTLFDEQAAPSSWRRPARLELIPALHGMITFLPDYAGYGVSAERIHPYVCREDLVQSVIDMIHAGRRFLQRENVPFSDDLYLWGFSEGGYVSLAVAHELETHSSHELAITETHAVSGPYGVLEASNLILADDDYPIPAYVAYLLAAYNDLYWHRPATDFFEQPYAGVVERFLARDAGLGDLANSMPETLGPLLTDGFRNRFREAHGEQAVKASLALNDVPAWIPRAPVVLYHGTVDQDVPIQIARKQFEAMLAKGADPQRLKFVSYEGADHTATIYLALATFLEQRR